MEVEIEVVVLGERVEVCQVHVEEVLRTKCSEGSHAKKDGLGDLEMNDSTMSSIS